MFCLGFSLAALEGVLALEGTVFWEAEVVVAAAAAAVVVVVVLAGGFLVVAGAELGLAEAALADEGAGF